jgi:hypothetical protein
MEPNFLLPQSMEGANLHTVTVDPETHARLEALLEAAGKAYTAINTCFYNSKLKKMEHIIGNI